MAKPGEADGNERSLSAADKATSEMSMAIDFEFEQ